jgi:non-ribosomal peptide synthetase component F
LPIQLADFAHWQRRVFAGEALAAQLAWWRETLAELPPRPGLPIDLPRPEEPGSRAVNVSVKLAPRPAHVLRTLAQTAHCSLPMVLLAVVDALLHVYNGQEDLIVSLIFAARNRPELSGQIGLFMNTVPLRVDLAGNPTFRQLTERVRDATIEAYSHQDVPFPRLLQELFPGRKLTRTLLTGVCFNMLSFAEGAGAPGGGAGGPSLPGDITVQQIESEEGGTKHDLVFTSAESGGTVNFDLTGAADLFTPGQMRTIARDFEALLAEIANDPDVPLARLREKLTR